MPLVAFVIVNIVDDQSLVVLDHPAGDPLSGFKGIAFNILPLGSQGGLEVELLFFLVQKKDTGSLPPAKAGNGFEDSGQEGMAIRVI
jgi:hypothetical protein